MSDGIRVLLVGGSEEATQRVGALLEAAGLVVVMQRASNEEELRAALEPPPDVVLASLPLPGLEPLAVIRVLRERGIEAPLIVIAHEGAEEVAVECLKYGAADYVREDNLGRLGQAVRQALEKTWLEAERELTQVELAESRSYLATIFEHTPTALLILDAQRCVLKANAAAAKLRRPTGDTMEGEVLEHALGCLNALSEPRGCGYSPNCSDCALHQLVLECLETGQARLREECSIPVGAEGDGTLTLLVSAAPIGLGEGRQLVVALEDISERRAAEERVRLVNRVLEVVHAVGRLIPQEQSAEWLLAETCRTIVEVGQFPLVWVSSVDPTGTQLRPLAVAGRNGATLNPFHAGDLGAAECPAGVAWRSGRPVVVEDLRHDPRFPPLQELASSGGVRSALALPIVVREAPVGVLTVFADRPRVFRDEVLALFEGLAADLALALQAREAQAERQRALEALAESERNYRELFDATSEAIFVHDGVTGALLDVNAAMLHMYGFASKEEVLAGDIGQLSAGTPPYDQATALSLIRKAIDEGPQVFEWLARRRDGELFWTEVSLRASTIAGHPRVLAVVRDASDRKAAEQALRESEERFRSIFQRAPVGIYRTTPSGHIVAANPTLVHLLGYGSFDELAAANLEEGGVFLDQAQRAAFQEALQRDGQVSGLESRWRTRDGRIIWVREHANAVRGEGGELLFIDGIVEDITDRRLAEHAVAASEARYRSFFEEDLAADFIARVDGTLLDCNPAYVRLFGFSNREEALATNVAELFAEPASRAALLEAVRKQRFLELYPLALRRREGPPIHALANIVGTFDERGELTGTKGYLFDITELRNLEAQLRQAQKMEAVGRLAGGIAHDFNNLLQAMVSYLTLLKARLDDREALVAGIEELERSIRRGAALTRQLLVFSRRNPAQFAPFDLADFLRHSTTFFRRLLRENIAFELEVEEKPLPILGDRHQIEQVLMNLLVNASDAMPEGGKVTLRCREVESSRVLLEVTDTGCGMSEALRERIFEPFFTTKVASKGTGLGLAVVHGIVGQHGGEIQVESEEGRGTTFRILLPRAGSGAQPAASSGEVAPVPPTSGEGERILLVEDEEMARESLAEILSTLGYAVVAVGSGSAALALPPEPPFQLLLTDLVLPDTRGNHLAKQLLERWPNLKVLLMSGYTEDETLRQEILGGAVNFLEKPFDMETLLRAISAALTERSGEAPQGDLPPTPSRSN
jgi:two-component system cell cycle sensor histidine kinase/response regulator CckA